MSLTANAESGVRRSDASRRALQATDPDTVLELITLGSTLVAEHSCCPRRLAAEGRTLRLSLSTCGCQNCRMFLAEAGTRSAQGVGTCRTGPCFDSCWFTDRRRFEQERIEFGWAWGPGATPARGLGALLPSSLTAGRSLSR